MMNISYCISHLRHFFCRSKLQRQSLCHSIFVIISTMTRCLFVMILAQVVQEVSHRAGSPPNYVHATDMTSLLGPSCCSSFVSRSVSSTFVCVGKHPACTLQPWRVTACGRRRPNDGNYCRKGCDLTQPHKPHFLSSHNTYRHIAQPAFKHAFTEPTSSKVSATLNKNLLWGKSKNESHDNNMMNYTCDNYTYTLYILCRENIKVSCLQWPQTGNNPTSFRELNCLITSYFTTVLLYFIAVLLICIYILILHI